MTGPGRWLVPLVVLGVVATGCGGGPEAEPAVPTRTVTALDDTFTVEVPEDWAEREGDLAGEIVVAMRAPGGGDELLGQYFADETAAENAAIRIGGRLSGRNVFCERLDGTEVFGEPRTVFDCPLPGNVHKLLFPIAGEQESALLLVETVGATLEDTAALAGPIVESFAWAD